MDCDLHTHSTASDGTLKPGELATAAAEAGLKAIALTDHDTVAGLAECERACLQHDIAFVPGTELSTNPISAFQDTDPLTQPRHATLHILGLFIQPDSEHLTGIFSRMIDARNQRNPRIIDKLNSLGLAIDYEEIIGLAHQRGSSIVSRPHIAQVMTDKGYADSVTDAFSRYLGEGAAAYVPRERLTANEAIGAIHTSGGLAILAHPVQLKIKDTDELETLLKHLKETGLDGIETRHCDHTPAQTLEYESLAKRLNLMTSGGSDFHGHSRPVALGSQNVPISVYHRLHEAALARR